MNHPCFPTYYDTLKYYDATFFLNLDKTSGRKPFIEHSLERGHTDSQTPSQPAFAALPQKRGCGYTFAAGSQKAVLSPQRCHTIVGEEKESLRKVSLFCRNLETTKKKKRLCVRVLLIMCWLDPVSYLYQRLMKYNQVKT